MSNYSTGSVPSKHKRIAVIGGGISGISCLWTLKDYPGYEVHLYEAEDRLGGHAHTVPYENNGVTVNVDTGFIAMNQQTYPLFTEFLQKLGVSTISTDMSFGVSVNRGQFEWGSRSWQAFMGSWSNILRPWFWRLVFDILRFNITCLSVFAKSSRRLDSKDFQYQCQGMTDRKVPMESIGHFLERLNYSEQFATLYLIPMVAAPWCIDPTEFSRNFPAKFLIEFMADHRLLDTLWHTLQWRTFPHGSNSYVEAFAKTIPPHHHLHLNTKVRSLRRLESGKVSISVDADGLIEFDHVVLAVHAPQALQILSQDASALERKLLGAFQTSHNVCVLHADKSLLPRRMNARSSWNCLLEESSHTSDEKWSKESNATSSEADKKIAITFDMGRLQDFRLVDDTGRLGQVFVTMNPPRPISSPKAVREFFHPLFSSESVQASKQLYRINGVNGISFAGAWMGYGFHEDGFEAGSAVARELLLKDGQVVEVKENSYQISAPIGRAMFCNPLVLFLIQVVQFCIDVFTFLGGHS